LSWLSRRAARHSRRSEPSTLPGGWAEDGLGRGMFQMIAPAASQTMTSEVIVWSLIGARECELRRTPMKIKRTSLA
jgi:hypothetical protein